MKSYKGKVYLVLSSAQLGVDDDVVSVFQQVAKKYKAEVVHLGPLATEKELREYKSTETKLEVIDSRLKTALTDAQYETALERRDELEWKAQYIYDQQTNRINALLDKFGKLTVVTNRELSLPILPASFKNKVRVVMDGLELSKYLLLSSITPKGIKATRNPLDKRAVTYLKSLGKNWIVPFPVPSVEQIPKPGLNESYNYWTVGGLKVTDTLYKSNELYQTDHLPAAILVVMDSKNGEFHARHLHIDTTLVKGKETRFVADDGLIFLEDKVVEAKSDDKATMSTDDHAPWHHPGTLAALRLINDQHKPSTLINGGDAADFGSINRHAEGRPGDVEGLRLKDDLTSLRRLLDAQANAKTIKHKVLIDSNHHEWLSVFTAKNPALKGMLDWKTLSKTMFPDWDLYIRDAGDNKIFFFGDYMIRHGDKDGGAKKAEQIAKKGKYACGHFHRYVAYRRAVQLGCGAMLGPAYTGNDVNAWQSQVSTLTKFNDVASISPKVVIHDKKRAKSRVVYRDTIYEVDHYEI